MPDTLHVDELDVIADAFEMALATLSLETETMSEAEVALLRSLVIYTAKQLRREIITIDGDDAIVIAHDAARLFKIVRIGR